MRLDSCSRDSSCTCACSENVRSPLRISRSIPAASANEFGLKVPHDGSPSNVFLRFAPVLGLHSPCLVTARRSTPVLNVLSQKTHLRLAVGSTQATPACRVPSCLPGHDQRSKHSLAIVLTECSTTRSTKNCSVVRGRTQQPASSWRSSRSRG